MDESTNIVKLAELRERKEIMPPPSAPMAAALEFEQSHCRPSAQRGHLMRRFSDENVPTIRQMVRDDHDGVSISRALHRTAQSIRVKCCELGITLRSRPPVYGAPFKIPDHIFGRLHAEARKRGMKASSLVRLLSRSS